MRKLIDKTLKYPYNKVLGIFNQEEYWQRIRRKLGTTAIGYYPRIWDGIDIINDRNLIPSNVAAGIDIFGSQGAYYDGVTSTTAFPSIVSTNWNGSEGGVSIIIDPGVAWSDNSPTARYILNIYRTSQNKIWITKSAPYRLTIGYMAGNITQSRIITVDEMEPSQVGISWSKSLDRVRVFYKGIQVGPDMNGLGTWSVGSIINVLTGLGSNSNSTPGQVWKGWLSHFLPNNGEISVENMKMLGNGYSESPNIYPGFSVVFIPDPQNYSVDAGRYYEYNAIMNWVIANKDTHNIKAVLCVGDNVKTVETAAQWTAAGNAFDLLSTALIPYMTTTGNHDYTTFATRDITAFNGTFPQTRYSALAWWNGGFYEENHSENSWFTVTIDEQDYIFITLEYQPRADVLTWFDGLLTTHSTKKAIITTHSYLGVAGTEASPVVNNSRNTTGDAIWAIIKTHDNVIWVECGHIWHYGVGRLVSISDSGKEVNQVLANYQESDGEIGGRGTLRLVTFNPSGGKIYVQTFSTSRQKLLHDTDNQFTLNFPS